jgi:hypothetical protein
MVVFENLKDIPQRTASLKNTTQPENASITRSSLKNSTTISLLNHPEKSNINPGCNEPATNAKTKNSNQITTSIIYFISQFPIERATSGLKKFHRCE